MNADGVSDSTALWRAAFERFERLAGLDRAACDHALDELARDEPRVYPQVLTLIRAHREAQEGAFLESSAASASALPDLEAGAELGPYRLERNIGAGGMGEVWLARRADGLFEAPVALKLLHPHLATSTVRERFVREGRILGDLSHPNVAHLLDAGATPDGRLFIAIEFIDGRRIDEWCDAQGLDIPARLKLILQVCGAVSHAHAHLVVHRDLKPSNILVSADGAVKLLDFGIAKLIETTGNSAIATELTQLGGRVLTPEYAAPEQVLGAPVTVATDVYSLGVLLYLLLVGRRPYGLGATTAREIEREVIETEPLAPSRIVVSKALRKRLAGDLDTITLKALKKAPAERYASVAALAEDIGRYLADRPISAQRDSFRYRAGKYIRRNRLLVGAAGVAFAAVSIGLAAALWQAHSAQLARARAEDLVSFMLGDLHDRLLTVGRLDVLDAVGDKALTYFVSLGDRGSSDRELLGRAKALQQIGDVRKRLGKLPLATQAFNESLGMRERLLARHPQDLEILGAVADSQSVLGFALLDAGRQAEADAAYQAQRATVQRLIELAPDEPDTIDHLAVAEGDLAYSARARGDYAAGLPHALASVAADRRLVQRFPEELDRVNNLSADMSRIIESLEGLGRLLEAQRYMREAADLARGLTIKAPENKTYANQLMNVLSGCARVALPTDPLVDTLRCTDEQLAIAERLAGHDPTNAIWQRFRGQAWRSRAYLHIAAGQFNEARNSIDQAVEIFRALHELQPQQLDFRGMYADALSAAVEYHRLQSEEAPARAVLTSALTLWEGVTPTSEFAQLSKLNVLLNAWNLALASGDASLPLYREAALSIIAGRGAMSRDASYQRYWAMAEYLQGNVANGDAIARGMRSAGYSSVYFDYFRDEACARIQRSGGASCTILGSSPEGP